MMKRLTCAGTLALALTFGTTGKVMAVANGVIVISTRTASDALYRQISSSTLYDADDYKGPGMLCPGDAAMASLLQDYGYVTRVVPEWLLRPDAADPYGTYVNLSPEYYYGGGGGPTKPADTNAAYRASLVIVSGSGSSFDMPPPNTNGIPIIMGEHSCLGDDQLNGNSSIYMYGRKNSGNDTFTASGLIQYMKVVNTNHPIMQGIPVDSQGLVKIWRDPYPQENAHLPDGTAKLNYKCSWTRVATNGSTVVAAGTVIIGLEANDLTRVVFAVNPAGGALYDGSAGGTAAPADFNANHANLVHFFVNEHGSGDARRAFNALTDIGRVIFIRTCKWAMGETLTPYQPLGLIRISLVAPQQIQLSWDGSDQSSYKIVGTQNLLGPFDSSNWQTVAQDIAGLNGTVSVKFDISNAAQYAFLRVLPAP